MHKQVLIDTYLDQTLTGPAGGKVPESCFVFGTATSRAGVEWVALHDRQQAMIDNLFDLDVYAEPGYAVGALRSFVEPVVFASLMTHAQAKEFVRQMRIGLWVERRGDVIDVIDRHGEHVASGPAHLPHEVGVCVMPNADPREVCVMAGGPFGSRAISASLDWKWQRERLISALGCGTCIQGECYRMGGASRQGQVFSGGGPIALVAHLVPTRFTAMLEVGND